jgi:hypothetical protein
VETLQPPRARLAQRHLLRGLVGLGALLLALDLATPHPVAAIVCAVAALVSFRGCPTCWMLGWLEVFRRADGSRDKGDQCVGC